MVVSVRVRATAESGCHHVDKVVGSAKVAGGAGWCPQPALRAGREEGEPACPDNN